MLSAGWERRGPQLPWPGHFVFRLRGTRVPVGPRERAASIPNVAMALACARARTAAQPGCAGWPLARAPGAQRSGAGAAGQQRPARPGVRCEDRRHACAPNYSSVGLSALGSQPPRSSSRRRETPRFSGRRAAALLFPERQTERVAARAFPRPRAVLIGFIKSIY